MLRSVLSLIAILVLATACLAAPSDSSPPAEAPMMTWSDLTSRDLPQANSTHAYGDDPAQVADLWLPDGEGPFPVVLMIHGGCWQKAIADRTLMNYAAEELRQRGMAVWNIEYRGVDEAGGGYPGTFLDVRAATQELFELGPSLNLKTDEVAAFGHSAGGHLAAWVSAQQNIPQGSEIGAGAPFAITTVVNSGGLADLKASEPVTLESCLANIMDSLTGVPTADRPDVFADTSVSELLPMSAALISVNGDQDRIAPPRLGQALTEKALAAGSKAQFVEVAQTGHVELIAPGTAAFNTQEDLLASALVPEQ